MKCSTDQSCRKTRYVRIALMALVGIAALGWVVMLLWNWLIPALFVGAQQVNYGQALGILLLSKILFGGFRARGRCRKSHRQGRKNMTADQREQLNGHLDRRWGRCSGADQGAAAQDAGSGGQ